MSLVKSDSQSVNEILENFKRTSHEFFSLDDFKEKLLSGKRLNVKYGVDVTAPFLHLGHAVNLWMMRTLQEYGHKVQFLIGDFTTQIGDPTGKSDTRPVIAKELIEENAQKFIKQVSLILKTDNPELFEVRRNSEWFEKMNVNEFLDLLSMVTHTRLISRDMFQKRIEEDKDIYMNELLYPILQGYDSYVLDSDLTIVGSDQLFNEMMGKFYQDKFHKKPQTIITTKITPGLDGKNKQSKSLNNYIALADTPKDKFGKAMSMPDDQITQWMEVYTDMLIGEIKEQSLLLERGENPKNVKLRLAFELVKKYDGKKAAEEEQNWFAETFSAKRFPDDCDIVEVKEGLYGIMDLLQMYNKTIPKSQYRRLIEQGGVQIAGIKATLDTKVVVKNKEEIPIKWGKKRYLKILGVWK